jgi:hypothetical protein
VESARDRPLRRHRYCIPERPRRNHPLQRRLLPHQMWFPRRLVQFSDACAKDTRTKCSQDGRGQVRRQLCEAKPLRRAGAQVSRHLLRCGNIQHAISPPPPCQHFCSNGFLLLSLILSFPLSPLLSLSSLFLSLLSSPLLLPPYRIHHG